MTNAEHERAVMLMNCAAVIANGILSQPPITDDTTHTVNGTTYTAKGGGDEAVAIRSVVIALMIERQVMKEFV